MRTAHAIFALEKYRHSFEVTLHSSGREFIAQDTSEDMYASVDSVIEKLERQILKHKGKLHNKKRPKLGELPVDLGPEETDDDEEREGEVSAADPLEFPRLTRGEAVAKLRANGDAYSIFSDPDDQSCHRPLQTGRRHDRSDRVSGIMEKKVLSVKEFFENQQEAFSLEAVNGILDGALPITVPEIHRPGLALTGFMQNFLNERIQILGETEVLYLNTRTPEQRKSDMENIFSMSLVCIIVTRGLDVPVELKELATQHNVPLLRTPMLTGPFIHELTQILSHFFAPSDTLHGTFVDVYGVGLLFTGRSGIGKSEIALDLVERGHRLVADDTVEVRRVSEDILIGRGSSHLEHFMEIRGIGVINVHDLFGIRAIRVQKRLEVEVQLKQWDDATDWERQGLDEKHTKILGVDLPQVVVPLFPGKNITVISEVIAMNQMLKVYGINAAERFNRLLIDRMESDRRTRHYLRFDTE